MTSSTQRTRIDEKIPRGSFPGGFVISIRAGKTFFSETLLKFLFDLINALLHFLFVDLNKSGMFLLDRGSNCIVCVCLKESLGAFPFVLTNRFF